MNTAPSESSNHPADILTTWLNMEFFGDANEEAGSTPEVSATEVSDSTDWNSTSIESHIDQAAALWIGGAVEEHQHADAEDSASTESHVDKAAALWLDGVVAEPLHDDTEDSSSAESHIDNAAALWLGVAMEMPYHGHTTESSGTEDQSDRAAESNTSNSIAQIAGDIWLVNFDVHMDEPADLAAEAVNGANTYLLPRSWLDDDEEEKVDDLDVGSDSINNVEANVGGNSVDDAVDDPTEVAEVAEVLWLTEVTSVTPSKITLP